MDPDYRWTENKSELARRLGRTRDVASKEVMLYNEIELNYMKYLGFKSIPSTVKARSSVNWRGIEHDPLEHQISCIERERASLINDSAELLLF